MNTHVTRLLQPDYHASTKDHGEFGEYIRSKESEGVCMCHLHDSDDYIDKIVTVSIEDIPKTNLEDESKFNLKK